jgi:hypothetical protein
MSSQTVTHFRGNHVLVWLAFLMTPNFRSLQSCHVGTKTGGWGWEGGAGRTYTVNWNEGIYGEDLMFTYL